MVTLRYHFNLIKKTRMKSKTNIIKIALVGILFLASCKKECYTITDFLKNKPVYPNATIVTYGQLDCDLFLVTVDGRKIYMTFNHQIISEQ